MVFEGNERKITTTTNPDGSHSVGTKTAAEIVDTVLDGSEEFFSDNVDVNSSAFFGFYMPVTEDGEVTGMVFAGKSSKAPTGDQNLDIQQSAYGSV